MFLTVKLLLGRRCSLEVSGQESVAMLKKLVSKWLQVPEERQHLLFRGQLLADDKCLSDYCIGPNASISVIMRPLEKTVPEEDLQPQPLWQQLARILAKHFGPQDCKAVLRQLRQEYEQRLRRMSLGQLEQLAHDLNLLPEEPSAGPAEERSPAEERGPAEERSPAEEREPAEERGPAEEREPEAAASEPPDKEEEEEADQ